VQKRSFRNKIREGNVRKSSLYHLCETMIIAVKPKSIINEGARKGESGGESVERSRDVLEWWRVENFG